jgi:ABC-2 type transport system ATP-binding protein
LKPVVQIHEIGKNYRNGWFGKPVVALNGVSFEVFPGQVFGLLGPNGAGKTTLIKILLGIVRSTAGSARLLDYPAGDRRGRRRVGYLPEHLQLARHQTARTALELYGKLSGLSNSDIVAKRDSLLELVGLEGRDRESVRRFSKGMQQRLGVAQALLHDPDVLILDEPTDGLDPVGRSKIRLLLQKLRDEGKTVFLNSHLLQEVELVCDRVAILDRGSLKFVGSISDLTPSAETDLQLRLVGKEDLIRAACEMAELSLTRLDEGVFQLQVTVPDQGAADALVDRMRQHDVSIVQLMRRKKTLEDAFLELITEKAELV